MADVWYSLRALCYYCVLVICYTVVLGGKDGGSLPSCMENGAVQLEAMEHNDTCGTVEGRVQICEQNSWKGLCDTEWTMSDATVTCKSLGFSALSKFTC